MHLLLDGTDCLIRSKMLKHSLNNLENRGREHNVVLSSVLELCVFLNWPKMVLILFRTLLQCSRRLVTAEKSRTNVKLKTDPKKQEANKNHFSPISEQACALFSSKSIKWTQKQRSDRLIER